jgi:hypothetical protein
VFGPATTSGPAVGFGYRYELDSLGIDLSFLNLTAATSSGSSGDPTGASGTWIKLMALYFQSPLANRSSYFGAGLGWGTTSISRPSSTNTQGVFIGGTSSSGSGLQAELSAGYEFLRASTIRLFVQADANLPIYRVHDTTSMPGVTSSPDSSYAPSFALSLGIGWGGSASRVRVLNN